jgi:hypothetical protein
VLILCYYGLQVGGAGVELISNTYIFMFRETGLSITLCSKCITCGFGYEPRWVLGGAPTFRQTFQLPSSGWISVWRCWWRGKGIRLRPDNGNLVEVIDVIGQTEGWGAVQWEASTWSMERGDEKSWESRIKRRWQEEVKEKLCSEGSRIKWLAFTSCLVCEWLDELDRVWR